jgi:hypothetical protein
MALPITSRRIALFTVLPDIELTSYFLSCRLGAFAERVGLSKTRLKTSLFGSGYAIHGSARFWTGQPARLPELVMVSLLVY